MIQPSESIYRQLQAAYNSIPIYCKIKEDYFTPIAIFEKLKSLNPSYLLESVGLHQDHSRYSYIGFKDEIESTQSLTKLEHSLKNNTYVCDDLPPFYNGYIGYLSYDAVELLHPIELKKKSGHSAVKILFSKITVIFDHFTNEIYIVYNSNDRLHEYPHAVTMINLIKEKIQSDFAYQPFEQLEGSLPIKSNMTKDDFCQMVDKSKDYIVAGDIFQVVLSQEFSAECQVEAFEIYKKVRQENPSPYLSYIDFGDLQTICSSPELLLKHNKGQIETCPIAGTRAVKNDGKDHLREEELINDEKELAEHLMLVDLGRNDVGKVSLPASVTVEDYAKVKYFSKVMHITSTVKGKLRPEETGLSALYSTFPAGTVSGAPKLRAMSIIDELEPSPRGLYAGSIFYLNHDGNLNSCIAIRTITITKQQTSYTEWCWHCL